MVSVNVCVWVCGGGILRESKSHFDYLNQFASDKMYSMYWHAIHYMKNSLVFFSFSRFFMLFSSVFPLVHMFSPFFLLFVVSLSAFSTFFPHFLVFLCSSLAFVCNSPVFGIPAMFARFFWILSAFPLFSSYSMFSKLAPSRRSLNTTFPVLSIKTAISNLPFIRMECGDTRHSILIYWLGYCGLFNHRLYFD